MQNLRTQHRLSYRPRLVLAREGDTSIGYLQVHADEAPVRIGPIDSSEYRLVRSLFRTPHQPRFHALKGRTEGLYAYVTKSLPLEGVHLSSRMRDCIESTLESITDRIRSSEAGRYLSFKLSGSELFMQIRPRS